MNKVILVGNIAREPELRQTPQGTAVARFTVAVQRRYNRDGQQQVDFISCVAWRNTAEFLCRYFHKGSGIQLCGSIQTRSWDGQDGQKHYATEVVADEVGFNGPKADNQQNNGGYPGAHYSRPPEQAHPDYEGCTDLDDVDPDNLPF